MAKINSTVGEILGQITDYDDAETVMLVDEQSGAEFIVTAAGYNSAAGVVALSLYRVGTVEIDGSKKITDDPFTEDEIKSTDGVEDEDDDDEDEDDEDDE